MHPESYIFEPNILQCFKRIFTSNRGRIENYLINERK